MSDRNVILGSDSDDSDRKHSNENIAIISILSILIVIYIYLLVSPTQPHLPTKARNFVIRQETKANFDAFMSSSSANFGGRDDWGSGYNGSSSKHRSRYDDYPDFTDDKESKWGNKKNLR